MFLGETEISLIVSVPLRQHTFYVRPCVHVCKVKYK